MTRIVLGFVPDPLTLRLDMILPSRKVPEGLLLSHKYKRIRSSIEAVGLIEPLAVGPADKTSGLHTLLDGHIRVIALVELGFSEAPCLVATDDECYTYNKQVNRVSTIQEHVMLRRAIDRGVTPARLAEALGVDISLIHKKMNLLDGICAEAAELLKDRHFSADIGQVVRKMKPTRQIECVELMLLANNITLSYARALLAATPEAMLVDGKKPAKLTGVSQEQMARMEREMSNIQGQYKIAEQTYGQDVLNLVLAKSYLAKLLENASVTRFLQQRQPEVLVEFETIVKTVSLDQ
ncbi:MAG: chromosome partitioning protein ParB [Rhodocyclaceae bacterium]|nr:MAG: chromosome partitioning protein ParB [Rhodocyclaceae bacterium]